MAIKLRDAIKAVNRSAAVYGTAATLALTGVTVSAQEVVDEVIVTGIRGALKEAIDTKRTSNSVVDAISADDIGKFPDKNVADSLARITGVSVTRGFGEGEKISVRGTSPEQNRTLLNGSSVASADWFVLDNPSRAFNYTLLPSNVVSSLEVYKSPSADIQEGSLGGTVYLRTRRPLELDAHTGALQVQGQYSDKSEEWDPLLSGMYSWKNDEGTFGVLVSLTKQDRTLQRDGLETLGHHRQTVDGADYWAPSWIGSAFFQQERERETGLLSVQWAPTDELELTFTALDSQMDADNINSNLYVRTGGRNGLDGELIDPVIVGNEIVGGSLVADGAAAPVSELYTIDRVSSTETQAFDLEAVYTTDEFILSGKIGTTEATGGTSNELQYGFNQTFDRIDWSAQGGTLQTSMLKDFEDGMGLRNETNADVLNREFGWMGGGGREMNDEEDYAQIDLELPFEENVFTSVKTGIYYSDHDKSQTQFLSPYQVVKDSDHVGGAEDGVWGVWNPGVTQPIGANWGRTYDEISTGELTPSNYLDGVAGPNTVTSYPIPDRELARSVLLEGTAAGYPVILPVINNIYNVNEEILAAYVKAEYEVDGVRGDIGLRVVKTDVASTGYSWTGDALGAACEMADCTIWADAAAVPGSNAELNTQNHDYTEFLPNINAIFDVTDTTILRLSAARVMARPDYITIANQEGANIPTQSGSRGNPYLDPVTADQFDISYEWYFADEALLAATFFYKDIKGSVLFDTVTESRYDPQNDVFVDVVFRQPTNGKGDEVSGIELGYQQSFGDFGVVANYTYTDAESAQERDPVANPGSGLVVGNSQNMYNLTGYYENDLLSARVSYNYRSEWFNGVNEFGSEAFNDEYGQWDASVTFRVTDFMDIVVEGVNLTDEEIYQYHIDKASASAVYTNGRRFVAGVNFTF
jgi:iron complex outermembrane recepter protein